MDIDLAIQMKLDRIIKNANQTVFQPPKIIKSHVTQEMIDDYKERTKRGIQIDGKMYKYNPGSMVVNLERPNIILTDAEKEMLNPKTLQNISEETKKQLDDLNRKMQKVSDDYDVKKNRSDQKISEKEEELRKLLRAREMFSRNKIKNKKEINRLNILIEAVELELVNLKDEIQRIYEEDLAEYRSLNADKQLIAEGYDTEGASFNQLMALKDADEVEINRVAQINKQKIDDYIANLKAINPKPINYSKQIGETDEDFLQRIQDEVKEEDIAGPDPEQQKIEALSLNRKQLMSNLEDVTSDYNKRENIIGELIRNESGGDPITDRIYEAVKYWAPILKYIKRIYPTDKIAIKSNQYTELIKAYVANPGSTEQIQMFQDEMDEKEKKEGKEGKHSVKKIKGLNIILTEDKYSVMIQDDKRNVVTYLKGIHGIVNPGSRKESTVITLLASNSGTKGTFKKITNKTELQEYASKEIIDILAQYVEEGEDIIKNVLIENGEQHTDTSYKKLSFIKKLAALISKIEPEQDPGRLDEGNELKAGDKIKDIIYRMGGKNKDKKETIEGAGIIRGSGISKPNIYQRYGNILINIKKLNSNVLAIKDDKERSIYGFPNKKISDSFIDIVNMLIDNIPLNDAMYKGLDEDERILFDQLITYAGTRKKTKKDINESIKYLKNRYNVLSGSIEAGNDNPELLKEIKLILQQLYKMNQIKPKDIKDLIKNLEV